MLHCSFLSAYFCCVYWCGDWFSLCSVSHMCYVDPFVVLCSWFLATSYSVSSSPFGIMVLLTSTAHNLTIVLAKVTIGIRNRTLLVKCNYRHATVISWSGRICYWHLQTLALSDTLITCIWVFFLRFLMVFALSPNATILSLLCGYDSFNFTFRKIAQHVTLNM